MLHRLPPTYNWLPAIEKNPHSSFPPAPNRQFPAWALDVRFFPSSLGETMKHSRQPKLEVRGSPGLKSLVRDWPIVSG